MSMIYRVVVVKYNKSWPVLYEKERQSILQQVGKHCLALEHVGSTAVPGMYAKPIIDMMLGVENLSITSQCIELLAKINYIYRPEFETFIPERRFFDKGLQKDYYHLHLVELNSSFWQDHIVFRDYLKANPDAAAEYSELKRRLVKSLANDRFGYTNAKTAFIESVVASAKKQNAFQTT